MEPRGRHLWGTSAELAQGDCKQLKEYSTKIAGTIEKQDATTRDISRNIHNAANGRRSMSTALVAVRENADTAKNSAQKLVEASNSVARNTRELGGNLSDHFAGRRRDSA